MAALPVAYAVLSLVLAQAYAHPLTFYKNNPSRTYVQCPDGGSCTDDQTCCPVGSLKYGCCPSPEAVCCSDQKHCCPEGYTCGDSGCAKGVVVHPFLQFVARQQKKVVLSPKNACPDGSSCTDDQTCCSVGSLKYGCCPSPEAVCCSDQKHCCPEGYTCGDSGCAAKGVVVHPFLQFVARQQKKAVLSPQKACPDGASSCTDNQTCCLIEPLEYGCCPKPNAVCCLDMKHCCPEGYTCGATLCNEKFVVHPLLDLAGSSSRAETGMEPPVRNVICPNGNQECPDNQTCCKVASGDYGCCPKPNAVCCSDEKHCCPSETTCVAGACKPKNNSHPMLELIHPRV